MVEEIKMILFKKNGPGLVSLIVGRLEKGYPSLPIDLELARMEFTPNEYIAKSIQSSLVFFLIFSIFIIVINFIVGFSVKTIFFLIVPVILTILMFYRYMRTPRIRIKKNAKNINLNLVPALRNITIELSAGMPLYNVLATLSKENYGVLSKMLRETVNKIALGTDEIDALEELSRKSPSEHLKMVIEHIVNGIVSGGETTTALRHITERINDLQFIEMQTYREKTLKMVTVIYFVGLIVLPTLAFTYLVALYSFVELPIPAVIPFTLLIAYIVGGHVIAMGYIKTKMPTRIGNA